MLLYAVLKETANDGQPHKNSNEHNRMPRWSNERTAGEARSKVRVCGHRAILSQRTPHSALLGPKPSRNKIAHRRSRILRPSSCGGSPILAGCARAGILPHQRVDFGEELTFSPAA